MRAKTKRLLLYRFPLVLIVCGIGVAYAMVQANSGMYRMPNSAMEPTIKTGESFRADLSAYASANPQRWELVVFRSPEKMDRHWVFRIIGLPGETISFDDNGPLIDGKPVDFPQHLSAVRYANTEDAPKTFVIPEASYFVLGDNSAKANDSRFWGAVSRDAIIGRVDEH